MIYVKKETIFVFKQFYHFVGVNEMIIQHIFNEIIILTLILLAHFKLNYYFE